MRFGHCQLAAHAARWRDQDRICECNLEEETVGHFLLRCPEHSEHRRTLLAQVATVHRGEITEEVLLGTASAGLEFDQKRTISEAVFSFVNKTKRKI